MSKQLMLPANRAFNSNGIGVPYAVAKLYTTGTLTPQPFYSDAGLATSLGSSLTASGSGRFPTAYQDDTTAFRFRVEDATGAELDDIDPFYFGLVPGTQGPKGDPGSSGEGYTARSLIAALTPSNKDDVYLTETGRAGKFIFDSSDLSAKVTADTAQGIYIAPSAHSTGASGAWVRKFDGPHNVLWWGMSPSATASANNTAFQAALDYLEVTGPNTYGFGANHRGGATLFIPRGNYSLSAAIDVKSTCIIEGEGGHDLSAGVTVLKWAAGTSGIRIQRTNTSGDSTYDTSAHDCGDGTILRNLWLEGGYAGTEAECHAVHSKTRWRGENVLAHTWQGDGFHMAATAGSADAFEGNANNWRMDSCAASNCRNGLSLEGSDTNAGLSIGFNASSCRQWGIFESSFLKNRHMSFHLDANGIVSGSITLCAYSGHYYYCVPGQETWCSTNAPSGTTAHNQGWGYLRDGSPTTGATAWTTGLTWRAGGPICTDGLNAEHIIEGYVEGGQPPSMFQYPTICIGGNGNYYGTTTAYGAILVAATPANGFAGLRSAGDFKADANLIALGVVKVGSNQVVGARGAAITALSTTATTGSLPTADGSVTIANAASPTNAELLEFCRELQAKQETLLSRLRAATGHGLIS